MSNTVSGGPASGNPASNRYDEDYANHLERLYQTLHRHPELSFHEEQTSQRIAHEMRTAGFEVTEGVGVYGVVGVLKNGDGPTVMIRTDMDALPIHEKTGLAYASETEGVMHACGHDAHMTTVIGTARQLACQQDQWQGTLVVIGQPAEEIVSGAQAMLDDGLYQRFPRPDAVLGLHVEPSGTLPAGTVGYCSGFLTANSSSVDVTVKGVGGHGSAPEKTIDPVVLAAELVVKLQTIVSREISALEPVVITVGSIHGGTKHNIICDQVKLELSVRCYADETRDFLYRRIQEVADGVARTARVSDDLMPVVEIRNGVPALYNDPSLTDRVVAHWQSKFGSQFAQPVSKVMGGEDFALYGRQSPDIPIMFFLLGSVTEEQLQQAKRQGKDMPYVHSPHYKPAPEPTIKTGVAAMTEAALCAFQSTH
ncbi:Hippurate hydrolase [BD1-7 clade bacterium]|uniref:Hippurate hydrolase n=1 Tax=BD1-7 clade bacterium TaxID=2029982 RepID=A0A5S9Q5P7_9GAMM|nr:Hippurate hydrolase [BD1-7 clade bacterium]CAA0113148.1 Hippurate hydrolase [BD1-7 clade bacterium]